MLFHSFAGKSLHFCGYRIRSNLHDISQKLVKIFFKSRSIYTCQARLQQPRQAPAWRLHRSFSHNKVKAITLYLLSLSSLLFGLLPLWFQSNFYFSFFFLARFAVLLTHCRICNLFQFVFPSLTFGSWSARFFFLVEPLPALVGRLRIHFHLLDVTIMTLFVEHGVCLKFNLFGNFCVNIASV